MIRKRYMAGIAQLCPTRGTRTPFNQDLSEGLTLRPFLQNVYSKPLEVNFKGLFRLRHQSLFLATIKAQAWSQLQCFIPLVGPKLSSFKFSVRGVY